MQPSLKCICYISRRIWASFTLKQWQPGVITVLSQTLMYEDDPGPCVSLLDASRHQHHSLTQNTHTLKWTSVKCTRADAQRQILSNGSPCPCPAASAQEEENKSSRCLLHPGPVIKKINPRWEIYKACPSSGLAHMWKPAAGEETCWQHL